MAGMITLIILTGLLRGLLLKLGRIVYETTNPAELLDAARSLR
jgi:hypothetical protein